MNKSANKFLMLFLVIGFVILSGCSKQSTIGCTKEAKICPDGSAVGRTGPNCEFESCPTSISNTTQIANPASEFCVNNSGNLDIRTSDDGSQTGYCNKNGKTCEEWAFYRGECSLDCDSPDCNKSITHVCTAAQKSADVCTLEYMPVCGSDGKTYGNGCQACAEEAVDSWTNGECG